MFLHASKIFFPIDNSDFRSSEYVLLGIPLDSTSSFLPGQRFGPSSIRRACFELETFDMETGIDLKKIKLHDVGDLHIAGSMKENIKRIKETIAEFSGKKTIVLGGEHSITYPIVKAINPEAVISLDAHFDLRNSYLGDKLSHACVMRRIYELGIEEHILGTREASKEDYEFLKNSNIKNSIPEGKKVYLTIDMDVFDLENVGNYVPGGMSFSEGIEIIKKIVQKNEILGFDICEVCSRREDKTSITAGKLLYKILGYMEKYKKL